MGHGRDADQQRRDRPLTWLVIAAVVAFVVVISVIVLRRSRRPDGVAAFQRQIDALSPEARRPVVDKVQQLEDQADIPPPPAKPPADDET